MHGYILQKIEAFVDDLYLTHVPAWRTFHSIHHTKEVVRQCQVLGSHYSVPEDDFFALISAAWFHDTGYSKGSNDHEWNSVTIANSFLSTFSIEKKILRTINHLIMATKFPAKPVTLSEQILCDCDLHHLGSQDYSEWSSKLRMEIENDKGTTWSDEEWRDENIRFFTSHYFFTDFARTNWEQQKDANLRYLTSMH